MKTIKSLITISVLFCVVIFTIPVTKAIVEEKLWAVIVCGTNDLKQESDFLYETLTTYYDFDGIYYLHVNTSRVGVDALATRDNVRYALNTTLTGWSTDNDMVFIYFMSHGGGLEKRYFDEAPYFICSNFTKWAEVSWDNQGKPSYSDEGNEMKEAWLYNFTDYNNHFARVTYGWDVNNDGDINDWVGIDECIGLGIRENPELHWDDKVRSDLSNLHYSKMIFIWAGCKRLNSTEGCHSGGIIDDLSAPNRIIVTPTNETSGAWMKMELIPIEGQPGFYHYTNKLYNLSWWGEQFISALGRNSTQADVNNDNEVSVGEAFDFAWKYDKAREGFRVIDPIGITLIQESPWLDDNGNGLPTFVGGKDVLDLLDGSLADGLLAYETYFGFDPIRSPDINGNHRVDYEDLFILADAYGSFPGNPNWDPRCDLNNNGRVDYGDLSILADYYGKYY